MTGYERASRRASRNFSALLLLLVVLLLWTGGSFEQTGSLGSTLIPGGLSVVVFAFLWRATATLNEFQRDRDNQSR